MAFGVLILGATLCFYHQEDFVSLLKDAKHHSHRVTPVYLPAENRTDLPIIVWWTPFTPHKRIVKECPAGQCLFTQSRTEINNPLTEAVMFYGSSMDWEDLPLPRNPRHYWSLFHEESPKNNRIFTTKPGISLLNLTATFSRYSNYPLVTHFLTSIDVLERATRVTTARKSKQDVALVSYLQSDCNPPSDRDSYVRELMKYVSVDSYGKCLHNRDLPHELLNPLDSLNIDSVRQNLTTFLTKHKFSIAFENAICHDYITEKFWRPLMAGSVPIVLGSPTIKDWAPDVNHSIIVAKDYRSPKELAEYLLYLDSHDEEYEKYLEFKRSGVSNQQLLDHMEHREWVLYDRAHVRPGMTDGFECYVCKKVCERQEKERRGIKMEPIIASQSHYDCLFPEPSLDKEHLSSHAKDHLLMQRYSSACAEETASRIWRLIASGSGQKEVSDAYHTACHNMNTTKYKL